uniref:Structure-specific endonuclease subunit SLX4 n=1 Tax=Brachionus koreanus TaxID=1199090 RepID=A0A7G7WNI3_9BILA|nr:structure-specific endonuclease subunit SLX4 [Brachionus koreanus]
MISFSLNNNSFVNRFINKSREFIDRFERKQVQFRNKPLAQHAYQNYLKEKKIYNQELEEETKRRLLEICSKGQPLKQEEVKTSQVNEQAATKDQQQKKRQHQAQISKFLTPSQSNNDDSTKNSTTGTCSKLSFKNLDQTVDIPKSQEFKRQKSLNDSKSDISKYFSKNDQLNCPVCSYNLSKLVETEREKHVNQCLDRKSYLSYEYKPANKFKRNESKESAEPKECVNQNKLKSSPNETQQKQNESLLKDAVPNCPICGKVLHNFNIRQNHLKKCSQVFHIRTESLVELVRKQKEKIDLEISKGLIPSDVYIPKAKKQEKKAKTGNRVIKLEQPKSKNDEQLQIAIALSNSLNPAEDCPKQAEIKLFKCQKKNEKKGIYESALLLVDDETRTANLSTKFADLLEKQIKYDNEIVEKTTFFVKTKFKADNNYLWNKCKYFKESEDNFYVQAFLQTGRFTVGHQVFIDKTDQEKFSNIEVINTQTAYLLADLNDHTQENISIYLTQSQCQFNQTQQGYQTLNSICESSQVDQSQQENQVVTENNSETILKKENIKIHIEQEIQENKKIESSCFQLEEEINKESVDCVNGEENEMDQSQTRDKPNLNFLLEETIFEPNDSINDDNGLNDQAIFIDETHLSGSSNHKTNLNDNQDLVSEGSEISSDKNSNILDQNIMDESQEEMENHVDKIIETESNPVEILISDDSEQAKENKKRKSIDIIELNDSSISQSPKKFEKNKKFKLDLNMLDEEIEIICDQSVCNKSPKEIAKENNDDSSLSSLPSLDANMQIELDTNENKLDSNKNEERDVLELLEKSQFELNQPNDDALDEVWKNFGDDQLDCQLTFANETNDNWQSDLIKEIVDPIIEIKEPKSDQNPASNNDSDAEICDFIDNYSEKSKSSRKKSNNSTLDEEDLDAFVFEKEPSCLKNAKFNKSDALKNLPNFSSMATPDLKSELKKYGVKALPKKQAVKKLTEIYEFTSRKENKISFKRSHSCMDFKTSSTNMKNSSSFNQIASKKQVENSNLNNCKDDLDSMAKIMNLESLGTQKNKKKTLKKTVSDLGACRPSQPALSSQSGFVKIGGKKNKNLEMTLDEVMLDLVDEENDDETSEASESSASQKKSGNLLKEKVKKSLNEEETRKHVSSVIKSDNNLYLKILNYEPLDYEFFFTSLQTSLAPRKCNNKILMKVLDEFCVTFTLKNLNTRGASKLKSKKKH